MAIAASGLWGVRGFLSLGLLLALAGGSVDCRRHVKLDDQVLAAEVGPHVQAALTRPALKQALQSFIAEVAADKSLSQQGEALMAKLGGSPALQTSFTELQGQIGQLPQMRQLVMKIQKDNPGADAARIGQLAGEHWQNVAKAGDFEGGFSAAWNRLLLRPVVSGAFDQLGQAASRNTKVVDDLGKSLVSDLDQAHAEERLIALNGGSVPDSKRATDLFLTHAIGPERLEKLMTEWLALPSTHAEIRSLLTDLLQAPSFQVHVETLVTKLLQDPTLKRELPNAFGTLMMSDGDPALMRETLIKLLDTEEVGQAVSSFVLAVVNDPELGALGHRSLERIAGSPAFKAALRRFAIGW